MFVVANRVHPGAALEITRKDFEGSIERKIDYLLPFDQKLAAQAAKLGKPLAEAGKNSKTVAPLVELARTLVISGDGVAEAAGDTKGKREAGKGQSLMGKFGELKGLMPKRAKK